MSRSAIAVLLIPRELPAAPIVVLAIRIKHALDVTVQGPHDADARVSRVSKRPSPEGPHTFHRTAMLWSNRHGALAEHRQLGPRVAIIRVTLDWVRSANGYHIRPETNRSTPRSGCAHRRTDRARL